MTTTLRASLLTRIGALAAAYAATATVTDAVATELESALEEVFEGFLGSARSRVERVEAALAGAAHA